MIAAPKTPLNTASIAADEHELTVQIGVQYPFGYMNNCSDVNYSEGDTGGTRDRTGREKAINRIVAVTRIVNSCVLLELGDAAVLTDPWFTEHWYMRFGEPLAAGVAELPPLTAVLGSHALPNHWDFNAMAAYRFKASTAVLVATAGMARQARDAGFAAAAQMRWGESRRLSSRLTVQAIRAHYSLRRPVNNWVLSTPEVRVFFGGEARDLQPLREYRAANPPVDLILGPVNGLRILASKLVMGVEELLAAARILGARAIVPIHDAHSSMTWLIRRHGSARELERRAAGESAGPSIHCLRTGERWEYEAPARSGSVAPNI